MQESIARLFGLLLMAIAAVSTSAVMAADSLPAFPGAEGFGATTPGGRGGKVYEVTNLNDDGPGSLREAIDARGPRTVVFRVSGTINLDSEIEVNSANLTIAGQTAPGDGICLRKQTFRIAADDVVIRYIRFRRGDETRKMGSGIRIHDCQNVVIDHCSVSWSCDEGINTWQHGKHLTVQWCLVSEALHDTPMHAGHGYAATLGGENVSYHHNLFANCPGRNPSIGGHNTDEFKTVNMDFRNNVVFNWEHRTMDGKPWSINVINNYYKPGPASRFADRLVRIDKIPNAPQGRWYIDGNCIEGQDEINKDNWKGVAGGAAINPLDWRAQKPFEVAPVKTLPANEVFDVVLADVGATLPCRDPVDLRAINDARTGRTAYRNGIVNSQAQATLCRC
jgi:hypothetical protein